MCPQGPDDAAAAVANAAGAGAIVQYLRGMGGLRVADIGIAPFDIFNREVVGKVSRTNDLYAVRENEDLDRRVNKIIPMDQGIGDDLFQGNAGELRPAGSIDALIALNMTDVPQHEAEALGKDVGDFSRDVPAVQVVGFMELGAGKSDGLDDEGGESQAGIFGEQ